MALSDIFRFSRSSQNAPESIPTPAPVQADEVGNFSFATQNKGLPVISTKNTSKDWIPFGSDNLYPNFLMDIYHLSPIHQAILTQKAAMAAGRGFDYNDSRMDENDRMRLNSILEFADGKRSLEDLTGQLALDYQIFGAFAIEVVWSNDFSRIAMMKRVQADRVRIGKELDTDGDPTVYWYSEDWTDQRKEKIPIAAFNRADQTNHSQLLYVKRPGIGIDIYGIPSYLSAINWIELDAEIGVFHRSNIQNGFAPSMSFRFFKKPKTQEERDSITRSIQRSFSGSENAGKALVFFSDSKDSAPDVTPLAVSDLDKQFTVIQGQVVNQILTAHRVTSPLLFGIKTPGELGGTAELETAYSIFEASVVEPDRRVLEKAINTIIKAAGIPTTLNIREFNPLAKISTTQE